MKEFFQKHIFSSDDPKPASAPVNGAAPPRVGQPAQAVPMPGGMMAPAQTMAYGVDPQMVEDIKKIIARRPTPYTALQENANTFVGVIHDESQRVNAAFALLKRQGTVASQVISSIDFHIRDIETEKQGFSVASKQAVERKAGQLRTEADQLISQNKADEASIASLQQQIANMHQRIGERSAQATSKQMEASSAEAEIQAKTTAFIAAADTVIADLNNKKTSLSSMLG